MDTMTQNQKIRRRGTFWHLSHNRELHGYRDTVSSTFEVEDFNSTLLGDGKRLETPIPSCVKLILPPGTEPIADKIFSIETGWIIFSQRLVDHLWPFIKDDVEVFPAPLYDSDSGKAVPGWLIVNVLRVLDCVDASKSVPWFLDGQLGGFNIGDDYIQEERTDGRHIFRYIIPPDDVSTAVICSYELVKSLEYKGFAGLAFIRCRTDEDL